MPNNIEVKEEVQEQEITEQEAPEVEKQEKLEGQEEEKPEEEAAALIREDIENALRFLKPPVVPWRTSIRFNTNGSIDMNIVSADLVAGLSCCSDCCCPW